MDIFAFVDSVEVLEGPGRRQGQITVRLDAIPTEQLSHETDDSRHAASLAEMQTLQVETEASDPDAVREVFGIDLLREAESRWFHVTLGDEGRLAAQQFDDPAGEGVRTWIVSAIPPAPDEASGLQRMSVLDEKEFPDAEKEEILRALNVPRGVVERVACYRVGQGNMNAICDGSTFPLVYFDLGGGALWNARTYPRDLQICHTHHQPVILSHWDTDHWITARKDPRSLRHTWIAPRQLLGPTHKKLARGIQTEGRLLIWPAGVPSVALRFGEVAHCTGTSRNDSGLAVRVDLASGGHVLLPGDADYACIPPSLTQGLQGLVAAHHGARVAGAPPSASVGTTPCAYVAISYGSGNHYGHPSRSERDELEAAGWMVQFLTPQGGVQYFGTAPVSPPCRGRRCTLRTPQP